MRYFFKDGVFYGLQEDQITQDEKDSFEDDRVPCAPSGAVDVTEYAEDISKYSATHTPIFENGALSWVENVFEKTAMEQIKELENSITPRRYREAFIGSEESQAFIKDINDKIEALREQL